MTSPVLIVIKLHFLGRERKLLCRQLLIIFIAKLKNKAYLKIISYLKIEKITKLDLLILNLAPKQEEVEALHLIHPIKTINKKYYNRLLINIEIKKLWKNKLHSNIFKTKRKWLHFYRKIKWYCLLDIKGILLK